MKKLFAGFEGAKLHWNGHDTLEQTEHTPETCMAWHYYRAINQGAKGFRDTLPERFNAYKRWHEARFTIGSLPVVWSAIHFDQPQDPIGHAQNLAGVLGPWDRMVAFNEPSVGWNVSGYHPPEALALALDMMQAATRVNPSLRYWTADPTHNTARETWAATDELVGFFGREIEAIGLNYHAMNAQEPLRDVLRCAAGRYPDHQIAITETSAHHQDLAVRRDWWNHVQREIDESGVQVAAVTWSPWLCMSFEPGTPWPNGWPE